MGEAAGRRVREQFSKAKMAEDLEREFVQLEGSNPEMGVPWGLLGVFGVVLGVGVLAAVRVWQGI